MIKAQIRAITINITPNGFIILKFHSSEMEVLKTSTVFPGILLMAAIARASHFRNRHSDFRTP